MTGIRQLSFTVVRSETRELSAFAAADAFASHVAAAIAARGTARVLFASAPSQAAFLAAASRDRRVPWADIEGFHLDEWVGVGPNDPRSLGRYLRVRIPTPPARLDWINGQALDPASESARYGSRLTQAPIDIAVVGFGENGHLAFNEPGEAHPDDPSPTRIVPLQSASREQMVSDGMFDAADAVPRHAITVTLSPILRAIHLIAVVPGTRKATAVARALGGEVGSDSPASFIRTHPSATLFLDAESAALLPTT